MIVVDATVAAKWYLHESDSVKALALLAGNQDPLYAPDWIQAEVASAITRVHRMGGISRGEAEALISDWTRDLALGRIELESWQSLIDEGTNLALATGHGLIDCLYIACAIRRGATLVTTDEKLRRRGKSAYADIRLLA